MTDLQGFYYFNNVLDTKVGKDMIDFLNTQEWKSITASKTGRKVQQYGFEYDYSTRKDSDYKKIQDIPDPLIAFQKIALEMTKQVSPDANVSLNQCIVNRYEPGQGISAHIDKETFGPVVACFTLGAGTTITFSRTINGEKVVIEKYVEPNSLYFMTGDSRYEWKHEIKPRVSERGVRRETRISVTFRTVSEGVKWT